MSADTRCRKMPGPAGLDWDQAAAKPGGNVELPGNSGKVKRKWRRRNCVWA